MEMATWADELPYVRQMQVKYIYTIEPALKITCILKTTCVKRLPFQGPKGAIPTVIHLC